MASSSNTIKLLRQLISEIRYTNPHGKLSDNLQTQYVLSQFRKYSVTDQQLCKAREEMKFMAHTYLCYLSSMRKYHDINNEYKGRGERSVRETADMVGFKLPEDPK